MQARTLLLAVPSLAMVVVGIAMFGPGAVQPFDGARIRGGPTEGLRRLSWRITVLERFRSIDSTRDIGAIAVRARNGDQSEARARCQTRNDGTCDVMLDFSADVSGPIHAAVTAEGDGAILAEGDFAGNTAQWGQAPGHPARLLGKASGDFTVDVDARRGVFAAPFRDDLVVTVHDGDAPLRDAKVTLRTDAADLDNAPASNDPETSLTLVSSERGEVTFGVAPRMHTVAVDIEVTALGRSAAWHGILPVVPGAIWLDPTSYANGAIRVWTPVPRDVAYVTLATPSARLWGGVIPLVSSDPRGPRGHIDWPAGTRAPETGTPEPMWVTLSSDPLQTSAGTVGWPVSRASWPVHPTAILDERPFRDLLLLDGMPAAEQRDRARRYRARSLSAVALGAAALLEGVLLAHGAQARGFRAWAWTAIAIATVALAFAAIGVVVMWKTTG
ncbi:MAG TPA: hypothetical protein VK550_20255 [Polyangiaceae bacterium]|nr:hypothetical protein [Polyangiaceae bacterium]